MSDWKRCTLADLGEIVGGATPSTKNKNYYGGNISWITPKDLSTFHGRFINRGERNITSEGLRNSSTRLMPPHSVLFTSRAPIGYVAIAEKEVCTNQGFKSIIPNSDTDYLFLYYLLVHNRNSIENMGSGTTFKEVSGSVMKQIEVFVPSDKAEQRAIAEILGTLDDKIENNSKINHHLVSLRSATDSSPDIRRGKRESRNLASCRFSLELLSMISYMRVTFSSNDRASSTVSAGTISLSKSLVTMASKTAPLALCCRLSMTCWAS